MNAFRNACLILVVGAACLFGGLAQAHGDNHVEGATQEVFGHTVSTWAHVDDDERVTDLGATLPLGAVEDAQGPHAEGEEPEGPPEPHSVAVVEFPEAARDATVFDHLEIHYEAGGHPPEVYLVPHFDFHFNAIRPEEVSAIDCSDPTRPDDDLVPARYVLPPEECVPAMGMHALPAQDLEAEEPFSASLILGYYGGDFIFVEPMITQERLLAQESYDVDVPQLPVAQSAQQPGTFTARYDAEEDAYHLVFSDFSE